MNAYIAIKVIHISAILFWSATLVLLPALLARHNSDLNNSEWCRLRKQTRLVFLDLASPAALIAIISGSTLVVLAASVGGWLVLKLVIVAGMVMQHVYFGRLIAQLDRTPQMRSSMAHWILVMPAGVLIMSVIYLVTGKPI